MSTVFYKQGVIGDLQQIARKGLGRVARLYELKERELHVTSIRDGNHSAGSLHYYGYAVDLRSRYFNETDKAKAVSLLKSNLGKDYDVISHPSHIHVEYDPA